ncbi:hypothetical protein BHE74_00014444 [Ensete ventricosum]|nr:hypothetical protein GW17_00024399 [Ensete ventricosum]RWW77390.1 hypothetical protein BHE74_00014444 [Ensete ventricosum]RZR77706.1 hypothetical protein BHM03_00002818 [Ensete ventricosum]
MAGAAAIFPSSSPLLHARPPKHLRGTFHQRLPLASLWRGRERRISVTAASASSISMPINVECLETEFSGHGVTFEAIGNSCVVKMGLANGSAASLMLPCGLITSYKPYMWHGATFEVLHTIVSEGEDGAAVVRGGVSMDFKIGGGGDDGSIPWSPSCWSLRGVRGSPEKSIQVELVSVSPVDMAEVGCLVTLHQDFLGSELLISNTKSSPLQLTGSFISHLKVSTPDAAYAAGLQGSNYRSRRPLSSRFSMVPPDSGLSTSSKPWTDNVLRRLVPGWGDTDEEEEELNDAEEESEGEEEDDYARMTEKMSRIYTSAPRQSMRWMIQGRRNSVVVRRSGFEEFYMLSPGSEHEWYGKYAYICVGPSAQLTPLVLGPGEDAWRGAQYLHNPNL